MMRRRGPQPAGSARAPSPTSALAAASCPPCTQGHSPPPSQPWELEHGSPKQTMLCTPAPGLLSPVAAPTVLGPTSLWPGQPRQGPKLPRGKASCLPMAPHGTPAAPGSGAPAHLWVPSPRPHAGACREQTLAQASPHPGWRLHEASRQASAGPWVGHEKRRPRERTHPLGGQGAGWGSPCHLWGPRVLLGRGRGQSSGLCGHMASPQDSVPEAGCPGRHSCPTGEGAEAQARDTPGVSQRVTGAPAGCPARMGQGREEPAWDLAESSRRPSQPPCCHQPLRGVGHVGGGSAS